MKKTNFTVMILVIIILILLSSIVFFVINPSVLLSLSDIFHKKTVSSGALKTDSISENKNNDIDNYELKLVTKEDPIVYSIKIGKEFLSLGDNEDKIIKLLGKPTEQNSGELGPDADTYADVVVTDYKYDGLTISSAGSGSIFSISVSNSKYPSSFGISVGSKIEEIFKSFPGLGNLVPVEGTLQISDSEVSCLDYTAKSGIVTEINIYQEWP